MIEKILGLAETATYDFRVVASPGDPLVHLFEEWVPYYRLKWAVAAVLQPRTILEIGVRYGYSAHAFLAAAPAATYLGIDSDGAEFGGAPGAVQWAREVLPPARSALVVADTQKLQVLPGARYDLIHIDGQQDGGGTFHDLLLALRQADYILVDGCFWSKDNHQAVSEFLLKFNQDIAWAAWIPGYAGEALIKTKPHRSGEEVARTSSSIRQLYSADYFLKDCGGWEFFRTTDSFRSDDGRLRAIADIMALAAPQRVMDLGCGRGELSLLAAELGACVEAVDYSAASIEIIGQLLARQQKIVRERVNVSCADATSFIPSAPVDMALAADLVEHLAPDELERLCANVARQLTPAGSFVVHTFPNRWFYDYDYPRRVRRAAEMGARMEVNPRSRFELLMHINEQSPAMLCRRLRRHFKHVLLWVGSPEDPAGSLAKRCSVGQLAGFRDIFAIASQAPIDRARILSAFDMEVTEAPPPMAVEILDAPTHAPCSSTIKLRVLLRNRSGTTLASRGRFPLFLSYRWLDSNGRPMPLEGHRNVLIPSLPPERSLAYPMIATTPPSPGVFTLEVSPVQEHRFWLFQHAPMRCHSTNVHIGNHS